MGYLELFLFDGNFLLLMSLEKIDTKANLTPTWLNFDTFYNEYA